MNAAFVFIQVAVSGLNDLRGLHKSLHAVPNVKTVHLLAGPTDMIAYVEAADQAALMETLGKIRGTKGVASTDTRIVWPV
jgi:DNA-binding Lrp family transcriptional regulator